MTTPDLPHHHHSQWRPNPIKIRICLSEKSLKPRSRFFCCISKNEGYTIPTPCFFTITSKDSNSFRVQINVIEKPEKSQTSLDKEKPLSFHVISSMKDISTACSKLNLANALGCKIVAKLEENDVIFTIVATNQTVEKNLIKNFDLFDVARSLR